MSGAVMSLAACWRVCFEDTPMNFQDFEAAWQYRGEPDCLLELEQQLLSSLASGTDEYSIVAISAFAALSRDASTMRQPNLKRHKGLSCKGA
jgi:hypothetical protein